MPVEISWPVFVATVHPNIGGWAGSFIARRNIDPWYKSLKKPSWTPPRWSFGPAWTGIYCSMGYASHLVLRQSGGSWKKAALPLSIYGANLALNWAWTPIFFGAHKIKWALFEIIALWGTTAAMAVAFYRVNHTAGLLILPYLAWNTLAAALNYAVYRDNNELNAEPANEEEEKKE